MRIKIFISVFLSISLCLQLDTCPLSVVSIHIKLKSFQLSLSLLRVESLTPCWSEIVNDSIGARLTHESLGLVRNIAVNYAMHYRQSFFSTDIPSAEALGPVWRVVSASALSQPSTPSLVSTKRHVESSKEQDPVTK